MDLTGLLFFAGVLLAVGALDAAGVLQMYAEWLVRICDKNPFAIATFLGVSSAVVDNVPLVQASIRMFDHLPVNDPLWHLVALAAGTGGSILSIGSIAGVTLMTMEGVGYMWYVKKVSLWALLGFIGGIATYWLEYHLFV
jgi:Na+/H+ antiporter NhaD/arsenite permease-like protein